MAEAEKSREELLTRIEELERINHELGKANEKLADENARYVRLFGQGGPKPCRIPVSEPHPTNARSGVLWT